MKSYDIPGSTKYDDILFYCTFKALAVLTGVHERPHFTMSRNITQCYEVSRNITKCYEIYITGHITTHPDSSQHDISRNITKRNYISTTEYHMSRNSLHLYITKCYEISGIKTYHDISRSVTISRQITPLYLEKFSLSWPVCMRCFLDSMPERLGDSGEPSPPPRKSLSTSISPTEQKEELGDLPIRSDFRPDSISNSAYSPIRSNFRLDVNSYFWVKFQFGSISDSGAAAGGTRGTKGGRGGEKRRNGEEGRGKKEGEGTATNQLINQSINQTRKKTQPQPVNQSTNLLINLQPVVRLCGSVVFCMCVGIPSVRRSVHSSVLPSVYLVCLSARQSSVCLCLYSYLSLLACPPDLHVCPPIRLACLFGLSVCVCASVR